MHHRRTRRAMHLSRGLILGRVWQGIRSFLIGCCAITLGTMAITGHVGVAILSVCGLYLINYTYRRLACR